MKTTTTMAKARDGSLRLRSTVARTEASASLANIEILRHTNAAVAEKVMTAFNVMHPLKEQALGTDEHDARIAKTLKPGSVTILRCGAGIGDHSHAIASLR
jgi:hypothetical protein